MDVDSDICAFAVGINFLDSLDKDEVMVVISLHLFVSYRHHWIKESDLMQFKDKHWIKVRRIVRVDLGSIRADPRDI